MAGGRSSAKKRRQTKLNKGGGSSSKPKVPKPAAVNDDGPKDGVWTKRLNSCALGITVVVEAVLIAFMFFAAAWMLCDRAGFDRVFRTEALLFVLGCALVGGQIIIELQDWKGSLRKNLYSAVCRVLALVLAFVLLLERKQLVF